MNHNNNAISITNPWPAPRINPIPSWPAVNNKPLVIQQTLTEISEFKAFKAGRNGAIVVSIVDASSSMAPSREQVKSGLKEFISAQKQVSTLENPVSISVYQFANYCHNVLNVVPVEKVKDVEYDPTGMTALLDAVGKVILDINKMLSGFSDEDRPAVIVFVITDGEENASRTFKKENIVKMVSECESKEWVFTFMGANIDAFHEGSQMLGTSFNNTVQYDQANMFNALATSGAAVSRAVIAKTVGGLSTEQLYTNSLYHSEERAKMMDNNKK